jgi:hypothetical protein
MRLLTVLPEWSQSASVSNGVCESFAVYAACNCFFFGLIGRVNSTRFPNHVLHLISEFAVDVPAVKS